MRDAFDAGYQNEHLPDAVKAFSAAGAWRGWSDVDDNVHRAFYEFDGSGGGEQGDGVRRGQADDR